VRDVQQLVLREKHKRSINNQGRTEVRGQESQFGDPMGQEASLAPPCSSLRSFGSKYTALEKVLVTLLGLSDAPAVIRRHYSDSAPGEL